MSSPSFTNEDPPPVPHQELSKSQKKRLKKKKQKAAKKAKAIEDAQAMQHKERKNSCSDNFFSDDTDRHIPQWYPPGADAHAKLRATGDHPVSCFEDDFESHFHVPSRIAKTNSELIEAVNDFHFAMMNDAQRNEFYYESLKRVINPESIVVEIGTGSGLLAMMCAKLGARHVTAIEANKSLAVLATKNIRKNNFSDKITVVNKMSTDVSVKDLPFGKADILVSEILGTLLLSESALEYNEDARKRLLKPDAHIIPYSGSQYVTLVNCPKLASITSVTSWNGIDFSQFNALIDTASLLFTKQLGCRFNAMAYTNISPRIPIINVNFAKDSYRSLPLQSRYRVQVQETGVIHVCFHREFQN